VHLRLVTILNLLFARPSMNQHRHEGIGGSKLSAHRKPDPYDKVLAIGTAGSIEPQPSETVNWIWLYGPAGCMDWPRPRHIAAMHARANAVDPQAALTHSGYTHDAIRRKHGGLFQYTLRLIAPPVNAPLPVFLYFDRDVVDTKEAC
jgi:hypothetical protein